VLLKRQYITRAVIISGVCSCLITFFLFFKKEWEQIDDWESFVFILLIPAALTLTIMSFFLFERLKSLETLRIEWKVVLIALMVALTLYQFFFVSEWVRSLFESHVKRVIHFWCYFLSVGFVCSIATLYQITKPAKQTTTD